MGRPRGSKNRKTLAKVSSLGEEIKQAESLIASLSKEKDQLTATIDKAKSRLQEVNKSLRAQTAKINRLKEKQAALDAAQIEELKGQEVQELIKSMIADGKTYDDVIAMLQGGAEKNTED